MTDQIEQLLQKIGQEGLPLASDLAGKLLIYAEVEPGVISADMFWVSSPSAPLRFRFCSDTLRDLILSLWTEWQKHPPNREWRTMSYVIENGRFKTDFVYPDQIDAAESEIHRRPRVLRQHFGDAKVDYSRPRG